MQAESLQPPADLVEALAACTRLVCVGHVTPDADSLGAMCAAARAWGRDASMQTWVSAPDGTVSTRVAFMIDLAQVQSAGAPELSAADGILVLDTAKIGRCNVPGGAGKQWHESRQIYNVDHHISNTLFGALNWVVPKASSACELMYGLLVATGKAIDSVVATLLYAGLYTDTVGFSLPITSGRALRVAADLVDRGADINLLGERLSRSLGASEFQLLRTIYANTSVTADCRIAYATASYDEIAAAGCTANHIDDQVAVPRSLEGIKIAILLTEGTPGRVRINFRGEQGVGVLELARKFGGGGHVAAAGAVLHCGIDEAVSRVLPAAIEYLDSALSVAADSAAH